ncbi:RICIN domain-containing protein [Streptomyces sp. IBSNAI002]|uniref:RICIN domain-containing protein n=1 Tax=Streptomyces sp. IBSNAI002 TaxID=3457500 RepID=UPI003FD446C4
MHRTLLARSLAALGLLAALTATTATTATAETAPTAPQRAMAQYGPYKIVNSANRGNLLPGGYGHNLHDGIYMWAWNSGGGGDTWRVEDVEYGYYIIRNTMTNKCLKPGGQYGYKTYVTQGNCGNAWEFQWAIQGQRGPSGMEHKIVSRSTGTAMTPFYPNHVNQVVVLDTNSDADAMWWSFAPV